MRKILISEKGEFKDTRRNDYSTAAAVKLLAGLINGSSKTDESEKVETRKKLDRDTAA